jgi:membrane protein
MVARAGAVERVRQFLTQDVWSSDLLRSRPGAFAVRLIQLAIMVGEGFVRDRLLLHATALAYVTALSLIPLLALAFSLIDALGVRQDLAKIVVGQITAGSPQAADWILRFVEGVNFGGLGTLGATTLFLTTVLALGNIEKALNEIWGVRRQRTWTRRIPDYLAVLIIAPLLLGVALSLGTTLKSQWILQKLLEIPFFETFYSAGLRQAPTLVLVAAFGFVYWFLPNTTVRPLSALLGGVVAALLFTLAQSLYLGFNVGAARYNVLFGTFAVLPLFLVWIYFSWAIVLLGAEVAFAHQNLQRYRREVLGGAAGPVQRESAGLAIALEVARAFREGGPAPTASSLSEKLEVPVRLVREMLGEFEEAGIVAARADQDRDDAFQLGRPAERVTVADVQRALRGPEPRQAGGGPVGRMASEVVREIEEMQREGAGGRTLADLLETLAPSVASSPLAQ